MLQLHSTLSTPVPTMTVLISFLKLRCRTSLHSEVPPQSLTSISFFINSCSLEHHPALSAFPVDEMVEVQCCKRDGQQSFFIFSPASFIHSDRLTPWLLIASLLPSFIACRFSTSLSPRCSNFASAIHNIHAVSHAVFHLFEFQPLSLLVPYRSTETNCTIDATTSLRAGPPLHLVDFISDEPVNYFHSSNSSIERHYTPQSDTALFDPSDFAFFSSSSSAELHSAL
jgi:hypothetical protein